MQIHEPQQIPFIMHDTDSLAVDTRIIRDLNALKNIRNCYPGKIKLIVNEGCIPGCPYRTQHFYEMSTPMDYPKSLCDTLLQEGQGIAAA